MLHMMHCKEQGSFLAQLVVMAIQAMQLQVQKTHHMDI